MSKVPALLYRYHKNLKSLKMATHSSYFCSKAWSRFCFCYVIKLLIHAASPSHLYISRCFHDAMMQIRSIASQWDWQRIFRQASSWTENFFWSNKYGLSLINYQFHAVFYNLSISNKKNSQPIVKQFKGFNNSSEILFFLIFVTSSDQQFIWKYIQTPLLIQIVN